MRATTGVPGAVFSGKKKEKVDLAKRGRLSFMSSTATRISFEADF